jgi:hypothetical protein
MCSNANEMSPASSVSSFSSASSKKFASFAIPAIERFLPACRIDDPLGADIVDEHCALLPDRAADRPLPSGNISARGGFLLAQQILDAKTVPRHGRDIERLRIKHSDPGNPEIPVFHRDAARAIE